MPSAPYRLVNRDIYLCIGSSLYFFRNQSSKGDGLHRRRRGGQGGSSLYIYIDSFIYLFIYLHFEELVFHYHRGARHILPLSGLNPRRVASLRRCISKYDSAHVRPGIQSSRSPALPLGRFPVAVCVMSFVVMQLVRIAWKRLSKSTMVSA